MLAADDCWTDHRLVISRTRWTLKQSFPRRQAQPSRSRYDTSALKDLEKALNFKESIEEKLRQNPPNGNDAESEWSLLSNVITDSAKENLGFRKRARKDWFDENSAEISKLIDAKRTARVDHQHDPASPRKLARYREAKATCQRTIRELENNWWQAKSTQLQFFADNRDMRNFYAGTKEIYGPQRSSVSKLKAADNTTVISERDEILHRWKEHFEALLNRPSTVSTDSLRNVPKRAIRPELSLPPSYVEYMFAFKRMKHNKAAVPDNIPFELLGAGDPALQTRLFMLIQQIWEQKQIPPKSLKMRSSSRSSRKGTEPCAVTVVASLYCPLQARSSRASCFSASARSVRSQSNSGSSRPKWP